MKLWLVLPMILNVDKQCLSLRKSNANHGLVSSWILYLLVSAIDSQIPETVVIANPSTDIMMDFYVPCECMPFPPFSLLFPFPSQFQML
jgi:hypothetical protein